MKCMFFAKRIWDELQTRSQEAEIGSVRLSPNSRIKLHDSDVISRESLGSQFPKFTGW